MPSFVSLDVETANADVSSICQIGLVEFDGESIKARWETLVNPGTCFDPVNVSIHGIHQEAVISAPTLGTALAELIDRLRDRVVVAHSGFDRMAIFRACERIGVATPSCKWLDSATVARRTWPEVSKKGYGLANLAARLGIAFRHHDAAEDACAAGAVLVRAIQDSGKPLDWWLNAVNSRMRSKSPTALPELTSNEEGSLFGEVVAFTGWGGGSGREWRLPFPGVRAWRRLPQRFATGQVLPHG